MKKSTYTIPHVDVHTMAGVTLLNGFSEPDKGVSTINDGELDANQGFFADDTAPEKGLWDEK